MYNPSIKVQAPKSQLLIDTTQENTDIQIKTQRLQNSIKIQNLPHDYDYWEILEIFLKVGSIKEYYQDSKEMIVVFDRQESVFLSRFFNNHQFGKHEQTLRIVYDVKEQDVVGKTFKDYEINFKIDSGNTSYADIDFAYLSGGQNPSNATTAPPLLYNLSSKDTPNNLLNLSYQHISQSNIRSTSFIDVFHSPQIQANIQINNQQGPNQSSHRFLNVPVRQSSSNSPQIENKISRQSFISNAKQQSVREQDRQSTIHSYVRNSTIINKPQAHHMQNNSKLQNTSSFHRNSTVIVNPTSSLIGGYHIPPIQSKFGSMVDNKLDTYSQESISQKTTTKFKQNIEEINNSTISSNSSNYLEKTKKKSIDRYSDQQSENDEVASLQNRATIRRKTVVTQNSIKQLNLNTEEGLRQLFMKTEINTNGIKDENELFTYYIMRSKYLLFLIACFLFYWLY